MRKHFTAQQKAQIILEVLKEDKSIAEIASEYGVHPNQLHRWKKQAVESLPEVFEDRRKARRAQETENERQLQELYAQIGRLSTQVSWLKKKSGLEAPE
jgi:transposase